MGLDQWDPAYRAKQSTALDNGVNVLLDYSRQASFHWMWEVPPLLRERGYRVVGSMASLHSVLDPGGCCRIRVPVKDRFPFAWWPNPRYNVIVTLSTQCSQGLVYLPQEVAALRAFVEAGGGLVLAAGRNFECTLEGISPARLFEEFGVAFAAKRDRFGGADVRTLGGEPGVWRALKLGDEGGCIAAERILGRGRVVAVSTLDLFKWDGSGGDGPTPADRIELLDRILKSAAAGCEPVGGTRELPMEMSGGGPIYPELEAELGGVSVFYAANSLKHLVDVCRNDLPKVREQCEKWMPSTPTGDRMNLVVAGGDGGGWAINAYHPKEVGTITTSRAGLISIYGHEITHTLAGPSNDDGRCAGVLPDAGWYSEAHAGFYQGKIDWIFNDKTGDRGGIVDLADPAVMAMDLARLKPGENPWNKIWAIWQALDQRYGTTWYPRWMYVKNTRWASEPERTLTYEEMIEDQSIAVGEDLFPYYAKLGTSLRKARFPFATFRGEEIGLPIADIPIGPNGDAPLLEACGDWRKPPCHYPNL